MSNQKIFTIVSISSLVVLGLINLVQGIWYINEQRNGNLPKKVKYVGYVNLIIGAVAFGFAILHAFLGL